MISQGVVVNESTSSAAFTNVVVFDGDRLLRNVDTVTVEGGRIAAVGRADDLMPPRSGTEVIDGAGGLLQPGFIDAHVHPVEAGLERMRCDLSSAATKQEYLTLIKQYADTHPDEPWILGGGWQMAAFPGGTPTRQELDAVVGDRPALLSNRDHHGSWANSRALELAGLDAHSPDPDDGRLEREPDGHPTGMLQEGARALVQAVVPPDTEDDEYAGLMEAQRHLHSLGVTGWQDAIVGNYGNHTDTTPLYQRAADNGDLTAYVVAALWWDRHRGAEQVPELVERRARHTHPRFRATSVKIMQDGIPENRTAAMIDPYVTTCRCAPAERGLSFVDPEELRGHVVELDRLGFQIHVHAIGDRAVREALDAFEAARRAHGPGDGRHHIAHLQVVHPDDVSRFAELEVSANMQTLWATYDPQMVELNVPLLGPERTSWQYPFAALDASGAHLCAGSDWPVTSADPWQALHVAVNRTLPEDDHDHNPERFLPHQALTLERALAAYTSGSGWINRREHGIAAGRPADLVLHDRNPFAHGPEQISDTRVVATWVDGQLVHHR